MFVLSPPRRRPLRSLRRRFLVPFAVGVALLGAAVGIAAAWGARDAADAELQNRAVTAARVFRDAMETQQARLAHDATQLAAASGLARAIGAATSHELADIGIPNTMSNRFDYVAVDGPRGSHVYSHRGRDWSILGEPGLIARVASGVSEGGIAVTRDGTAVLFAAVPVRIAGPRDGVIVVGEPLTAIALQEIVSPLDLVLQLRTSRGNRVSSEAVAPGTAVRSFTYPVAVSRFSAGRAWLDAGLRTAPLRHATASAAFAAALVASGLALVILVLVATLLDRAVVRPLESLRAGITDVEHGRYDVSVTPGGVREFAEVGDGFRRMAAIVGAHQARLREQAACDPLTGLANHASFHAALAAAADRAQGSGRPLAVIALDIDHFKAINDAHGHPFGDEVLRTTAQRVSHATRGTDVAARLGGDEFAVLLHGASHARATEIADRICADLREVPIGAGRLSVSLGVASFPEHVDDARSLIEAADRALYAAKRDGRGHARSHIAPAASAGVEDATVASNRAAVLALLDRPEPVVPVFQPVADLHTGAILGYEALARFGEGEEGSPEAWFARAHSCGLGTVLEARAIAAALAAPRRPAGFLAINVAPSALLSPEIEAVLPRVLADVVIELTEHEPVGDDGALRARLEELRRRGARIALDDAGAGYAGLRQVLSVRPDILKLDRSLIQDIDSSTRQQAMVDALVQFARSTGALVCAEGIETLDQARTLIGLGVTIGQGFALGRPGAPWAPVDAVTADALRQHAGQGAGPTMTEAGLAC